MEGKVFSAELDPPVTSLSSPEKNLSVAELDQAISDVHRILEIVGEQVSVKCQHLPVQHLCCFDSTGLY